MLCPETFIWPPSLVSSSLIVSSDLSRFCLFLFLRSDSFCFSCSWWGRQHGDGQGGKLRPHFFMVASGFQWDFRFDGAAFFFSCLLFFVVLSFLFSVMVYHANVSDDFEVILCLVLGVASNAGCGWWLHAGMIWYGTWAQRQRHTHTRQSTWAKKKNKKTQKGQHDKGELGYGKRVRLSSPH